MPSPRPRRILHVRSKVKDEAINGVITVETDQRNTAHVITVFPPNFDAALAPMT